MANRTDIRKVLSMLEESVDKQSMKESISLPHTKEAVASLKAACEEILAGGQLDVAKLKNAMKAVNDSLAHEKKILVAKTQLQKTIAAVQKDAAKTKQAQTKQTATPEKPTAKPATQSVPKDSKKSSEKNLDAKEK